MLRPRRRRVRRANRKAIAHRKDHAARVVVRHRAVARKVAVKVAGDPAEIAQGEIARKAAAVRKVAAKVDAAIEGTTGVVAIGAASTVLPKSTSRN